MDTSTPITYLDYAAATPLLPEALAAMMPWLTTEYGNPSAIHSAGARARTAIEVARQTVARTLAVRPPEITFTSGGTESNNLAIMGYITSLHDNGLAYDAMEIITTDIEHPSVSKTLATVASWGVRVVSVPVDEAGVIQLHALKTTLTDQTVLCALAYVNSEIGTIQPIRAIRRLLDEHYAGSSRPILLVDAAQAPLWLSCQLTALGADILTLDAGKFCGPKGMGVVVARLPTPLARMSGGGGQEQGLRPGTENVAGIVGLAVALEWAEAGYQARATAVAAVRDAGMALLCKALPTAILNGARDERRVANNINISVSGLDTEYAVIVLDAHGVAASTKSACAGAGGGESTVVRAVTDDPARARTTLRLTLGPDTTVHDLSHVATILAAHTEQMATISPKN